MNDFTIRAYTKKELALMYFPDSDPRTAVNHLARWISRNKRLLEQLKATGYESSNKAFTPRQIMTLVEYLGEP